MKSDTCKMCKGRGYIDQPKATIKGSKSETRACPKIVDHFEEAHALLVEINDIYDRTAARGRERPFIRDVYTLLAKNEITRGDV